LGKPNVFVVLVSHYDDEDQQDILVFKWFTKTVKLKSILTYN
jgi:hypothetical protein